CGMAAWRSCDPDRTRPDCGGSARSAASGSGRTGIVYCMSLNLIKLCVGVNSPDELREWIEERVAASGEHVHVTRMFPRRADELLPDGSLYWVIRGVVLVRQRIVGLR